MQYKLLLGALVGASTVLAKPIDLHKRDHCVEAEGDDCIVGMKVTTATFLDNPYTVLIPKSDVGPVPNAQTETPQAGTSQAIASSIPDASPSGAGDDKQKQASTSSKHFTMLTNPYSINLPTHLSTTAFLSTLTPTKTTIFVDAEVTEFVTLTTVVDIFESGSSVTSLSQIVSTSVATVPTSSVVSVGASTIFVTVTDIVMDEASSSPSAAAQTSVDVGSTAASTHAAVASSAPASSSSADTSPADASSAVVTSAAASATPSELTTVDTITTGTTTVIDEVTRLTTITLDGQSPTVASVISTSVTVAPVTVVQTITTTTTVPVATGSPSTNSIGHNKDKGSPSGSPSPTSSVPVITITDGTITATATVTSVSAVSLDSSDVSVQQAATTVFSTSLPASDLTSAAQATATSDVADANYFQPIVNAHNKVRAVHGNVQPLTWDTQLAEIAVSIAKTCIFEHDMGIDGVNYGQNIEFEINPGAINPGVDAVAAWYSEEKFYASQSLFGSNDPGDNFEKVGHFTQMVWASTSTVGCGTVDCGAASIGNFTVCNYDKNRGNVQFQYDTNVFPPNAGQSVTF